MSLDARLKRYTKGKQPNIFYVIFCEWKSEKIYFEYLRSKSDKNIKCLELKHKDFEWIAEEINKVYNDWLSSDDFIYCVIDKDNHSLDECKNGCEKIEKHAKLILSNKSFEIRILMHFSPFEKPVLKADDYKSFINSSNNKKYFKSKNINGEIWKPYSVEIWEALSDKVNDAINNAKSVSKRQLKENNSKFECEAYTDIWKVVEKLMKDS